MYDMRLTKHEDGYIYGVFCSESKDTSVNDLSAAVATDLEDPGKVIAEPSGMLIGPRGEERVGDVSNVVFTNGAIVNEKNELYIYYASSDTRLHVATTTVDKMLDYVFNTPGDPGRSVACVAQRCDMISKNLELLKEADAK